MTTRLPRTRIAAAVGGVVVILGASQASGAAFALQENSGSGLGNAYAGGAAAAEDASTVWFNPAGMSRIGTNQAAAAINLIGPSMNFHNDGSLPAAQQALGSEGGDAGSWAAVPNLYLVAPINKQWAFGIGINAPFGLKTQYDSDWIGRFQAIKSDVRTINVNPAISYKFDNFTIGAGASYQHIKATFTSNVNYSGALLQAAVAAGVSPTSPTFGLIAQSTPGLESNANITGSDDAWGWNIGALYDRQECASAPRTLVDQVHRKRQRRFHQPRHPGVGARTDRTDGCRARGRRQLEGAVQLRHQRENQAAADGEPVRLPGSQRPVGRHGRRAVDGLEQPPGPDLRPL
jgi:long-chain fatty acid transport protein